MKILVTNDDGVLAEGLKTLAQTACRFGELVVYAPEEKCSGMSRAITISGSLHIKPVFLSESFRSVSGTPADCVRVAVNGMNERPDLILSDINNGYNLGHDNALYCDLNGSYILFKMVFQKRPQLLENRKNRKKFLTGNMRNVLQYSYFQQLQTA